MPKRRKRAAVAAAANTVPTVCPQKVRTPFEFFTSVCLDEYYRRHPDEDRGSTRDIENKCRERWALMSPQEKRHFIQMAAEDRTRYELEMSLNKNAQLSKTAKGLAEMCKNEPKPTKPAPAKKKRKDPLEPKRARTSYILFAKEHRKRILAANPDFTVVDVSKEMARMWADLDSEEKAVYVNKAKEDKERYQKEREIYMKKDDIIETDTSESELDE